MDKIYQLQYTRALVRRSVGRFWRRAVGWKFGVALVLLLWFLLSELRAGDRSWYVGVLGTVAGLGVVMSIALYFVHFRRAIGAYNRLENGQATLRLTERTFALQSAIGSSELSWNAITEVWKYEDAWLLVFSKALFTTLPVSSIDEAGREFIAQRTQQTGARWR